MKVKFESDRPAEQTSFCVTLVPGVQDLPDDIAKAMLKGGAAGLSEVHGFDAPLPELGAVRHDATVDVAQPSTETERPPGAPRERRKER